MVIVTNLTSIHCVYKQKIVKNVSFLTKYKFKKLQHSPRIVKKSI